MGLFNRLFRKQKATGQEAPAPRTDTADTKVPAPAATEQAALSPVEVLVSQLKTPNYDRRHMVFCEVVLKAGQAAVDPLLAATDESWVRDVSPEFQTDVRTTVIRALGRIGDTKAVPRLLTLLQEDANNSVRACAAMNLVKLRGSQAAEPLLRALDDKDALVRHSAAEGLAEIGEKRAILPLQKMRSDPSGFVRTAVEVALLRLGAPPAGPTKPCCLRCGSEVLTVKDLVSAARELGMDAVGDSVIVRSTEAHKGEKLEARKGFQCTSCSRIYCLGCILQSAPPHRNGGKACFECRSNYGRLS